MPFANIKVPEAALSKAHKEEIVHRVTTMFADGGYGRADEVFTMPEAYRAKD